LLQVETFDDKIDFPFLKMFKITFIAISIL